MVAVSLKKDVLLSALQQAFHKDTGCQIGAFVALVVAMSKFSLFGISAPFWALVIGVAGADALAEQLEQSVAGHSVNGRAVQVKKVRRGEALAGLHVLYLGALEKTALQEMLAASRGLALLTVSDSDEVYAMGSMINFVMAEDKVRFDVALKPVAQAHIRISARMLLALMRGEVPEHNSVNLGFELTVREST